MGAPYSLHGRQPGRRLSARSSCRFWFGSPVGAAVARHFRELHYLSLGSRDGGATGRRVVGVTAFLKVSTRPEHRMREDERKVLPLGGRETLISECQCPLIRSYQTLWIAKENTMSILSIFISIEVLVNISHKLRHLANGNCLAVPTLDFSEHPLPINREDRIELGIAVCNSLSLDAHELQTSDNCELQRRALFIDQARQNARVFKRRLKLNLLLTSFFLCSLRFQQLTSEATLICSLVPSYLSPIGWRRSRSGMQLFMTFKRRWAISMQSCRNAEPHDFFRSIAGISTRFPSPSYSTSALTI